MTQLQRTNGHPARRQPEPQRREPERIPADERDVIIIHYGWKQAVAMTALAVGIGGVVMTLLGLFIVDILLAAAGG